jgi:ApaG protein
MAIVHHACMFSSEALTRDVRVLVRSEYSPDRSKPAQNEWFFVYTVRISNEGTAPVQLVTRHWIITDANAHVEEIRGPGVVGQQPILKPGESFEYTSGCSLATPFGVMHGTYQMIAEGGAEFDAKIAPFTLSDPHGVH